MKQLQEQLGARADAALRAAARHGEGAISSMRVTFALISAAMAVWMWQHFTPVRLIYLMLAVLWALQAVLARLMTRAASESSVKTTTLLDVTIVNIGLLVFVQWGLFPKYGAGVFLFYFPVLAAAAARFRARLVLQAALYAALFYGALSLYAGSPPWFRLTVLTMTALICALAARRPKELIVQVARDAITEAYEQGARVTEHELTAQAHALLLPPPLLKLPGLWAASKHGAGTVTGGDFFFVLETMRGHLLAIGDCGGAGFAALQEVAALRELFQQATTDGRDIFGMVDHLNARLYDRHNGARPVRCFLAEWEGEQMNYINAGDLPALHLGKDGRARLAATHAPLGLERRVEFRPAQINFPPRDLLLVFTDGVYTKLTRDPEQGVATMESFVDQFSGAEMTTLCHRLFDCAQPGYDSNPDDSTMVVIRRQRED